MFYIFLDKKAIDQMKSGEAVVIFTPDRACLSTKRIHRLYLNLATHYPIAVYAIERGLHVLITKPATQLLSDHKDLISLAKKNNVICWVEHHKRRVNTIYSDAPSQSWLDQV